MNTSATPAVRISRPDIRKMMPADHYKVPARSVATHRVSPWVVALGVLAFLFEKTSRALFTIVLVAAIAGIFIGADAFISSVEASPSMTQMREQVVPESSQSLR